MCRSTAGIIIPNMPVYLYLSLPSVNYSCYDIILSKYTKVYLYNRNQQDALFLNFILIHNASCFEQTYCPSSGILILYSQQLVIVIPVMVTDW